MFAQEHMLAVIEGFYSAALEETLWPTALKNLADFTSSQAASFWVLDGSQSPRLPIFICVNFDPKSIQDYVNGMASLDPTVRYLVSHPDQSIVHDGLLGDHRDKDSLAYYDWHERNVETRFRMVGQARVASSVQAGVALHRTKKNGKYELQEIDKFSVLHRHLERALAIAFRIGSLGTLQEFGMEQLDRNSHGVVLLDERKRVVFANQAAQLIAANGDGILLSRDNLLLAHKRENDQLQCLIARSMSPITSAGMMTLSGALRASRLSGKRPYGMFVSPITQKMPTLSLFRPAVCIVITDPERQKPLPVERLKAIFGFTRAEARLAQLLALGEELKMAAEKLEITYGTARTRLALIFQKTQTRRQAELITLLLKTLDTD